MNILIHKKKDDKFPELEWTEEKNDLVFTPESLNFNTIIRAFAKSPLQWQFLEMKICHFYLVEDGNVRLCDKRPSILKDESELRKNVLKVWRLATNIMNTII